MPGGDRDDTETDSGGSRNRQGMMETSQRSRIFFTD